MTGGSGGTGSSEVSGELKKYQGKYVDIGLDINDSKKEDGTEDTTDDWEIFYATEDKIFLIAADYVPVTKLEHWGVIGSGTTLDNNGFTSSGTYVVYWSTPKNFSSALPDLTEVMHTQYNLESNNSNPNSIAVSHLLDKDAWNGIKNIASKKASIDYVIGGPTLEMWCAAWGKAIERNGDSLVALEPDPQESSYGYKVKYNTTSEYWLYVTGNQSSHPASATLDKYKTFFPHSASYQSCNGYWLASPSASSYYLLMSAYYDGRVLRTNNSAPVVGVRPVVCLGSGVSLVGSAETGKYTLSN